MFLRFQCGSSKGHEILLEPKSLIGSEQGSYLLSRKEILTMGDKFVEANPNIKEPGQFFQSNINITNY